MLYVMTLSVVGTTTSQVDRIVTDHVQTLMHRAGVSQRGLAIALTMSQATLSRRLGGTQPWQLGEVYDAAGFFRVTLEEMTTGLPPLEEWETRWYGIRDSNPEPADMEDSALTWVNAA